jgi:very-short-patch-repair endonuclease
MRRHYSDIFLSKIDWVEIQSFYDEGNFYNDIIKKFNVKSNVLNEAIKLGLIKMRTLSESIRMSKRRKTYKHTQETKDKISKIRKEYLEKNPNKVPYLLNHSSKESYPEKYFTEVFEKEKIEVVKKHRVKLYELDFCILDKKIDIEIDGTQHYYDKKIVESDKKRTKFLEDNGWDVIRIDWRKYQKLDKLNKELFIKNLKNYINELSINKPIITIMQKKSNVVESLCICGKPKKLKSKNCNKCRGINDRKVNRPSHEQLLQEIKELGYCGTGKKYGVSDNAIRKWIKSYNN